MALFCDICGSELEEGCVNICSSCDGEQHGSEDWPEADDPEDMDYELQGGF